MHWLMIIIVVRDIFAEASLIIAGERDYSRYSGKATRSVSLVECELALINFNLKIAHLLI
jgi:hypothetical protein